MSESQLTGFEMIEKIGEGGMGHVWKARQLSLDRIVAIKLLPPRFSHDPESVRQIIQEARIAAKLKHSGIVQVYDANEQNGTFYFVMEYVDGYNVGHWVSRKKNLQSKDALIVVESVANALNYAWHTSGLIHCDLKLENIMVDQDGTIKVADLGLSLTFDSQTLLHVDEVAGTPGYISPEQVLGEKNLDCRADIYALGCCLYHMVTGLRPFHNLPDSEAMDAQVSSYIPDPREAIPSVSGAVCSLIERMLVKNRDNRLKDWQAVLTEVHRVQRGLAPTGPHPEDKASTMSRRQAALSPSRDAPGAVPEKKSLWRKLPWAALVMLILAIGATFWFKFKKAPVVPEIFMPPVQQVTNHIGPKSVSKPAVTPPAVSHAAKTAKDAHAELAEALEEIRQVTEDYVAEGSYADAIHWLENYFGRWASATATNRAVLAGELRKKMTELESARRAQVAWTSLVKDVTGSILTGKYAVARQTVEAAGKEPIYNEHRSDLVAIDEILVNVGSLNDRLLETFSKEVGKVASIPLGRGEFIGRVIEIRDRKIVCKTLDGTAQVDVRLEDIAMAERMRRLTLLELPEAYLVRGVNALNEARNDEAISLLVKTGPVLGPMLTQGIQADTEAGRKAAMAGDEAMMAFVDVVKKIGIDLGSYDSTLWIKSIQAKRLSSSEAAVVEKNLDTFLITYGTSKFSESNAELIQYLQKACGKALDPNAAEVAPQPVPVVDDPSLSIIMSSMIAKNQGMDQGAFTLEPTSLPGKTALRIASPFIRDVSPLADFKEIVSLVLELPANKSATVDVSALAGLPLKQLSLHGFDLSDPSRLHGMKLTKLLIPNVTLKSLTVLQGMPLTELSIGGAQINDLTSLQGMRLEVLRADNTKVASILPLTGMPLRELGLNGTQVHDVTYLQGLPLESLSLAGTPVADFSVLRNCKLTRLDIGNTSVRDLVFCTDMPLTDLDIGGTSLPSLAPLSGKTFKRLIIGDAVIKDVSALKSIKVSFLDLSGSKLPQAALSLALGQLQCDELRLAGSSVERIDFLRNNKTLKVLDLTNVKVSDLSPLAGLPIEVLNIKGVPVSDIAPIRTLSSLKVLNTDIDDPRLLYIIKAVPSLTRINGTPVQLVVESLAPLLRPNRVAQ